MIKESKNVEGPLVRLLLFILFCLGKDPSDEKAYEKVKNLLILAIGDRPQRNQDGKIIVQK